MSILIKFLFFFNIFNIFSADPCKFKLYCISKNDQDTYSLSFDLEKKKYTFEEFKNELDKKFNENKDNEDFEEFIKETGKKNYSDLLTEYGLLSFDKDYNIDSFNEIDLSDKDKFILKYSFKIDKEYNYEFYDIEIKDDKKKEITEALNIKEEDIIKIVKEEVKKLNEILNRKKIFVHNGMIRNITKFLDFKILNKSYTLVYSNYEYEHFNNSILDVDKNGFSFDYDYFKPIKATIIRRNYNTKQQYGQIIKKDVKVKSLNLLDSLYSILKNIFPKSNPNNLIIYKINEHQISDIKDKTSYDNDLKNLENMLRTNEITIDLLTELDTPEEEKKNLEEKDKKEKEEKEKEKKKEEQQKNKCCCY